MIVFGTARPPAAAPVLYSVSAASLALGFVAPESIVSGFGANLSAATESASSIPLPTTLAGVSVLIKDRTGREQPAPLFYVSPDGVKYQIPPGTAVGEATVSVRRDGNTLASGNLQVAPLAPALFAANGDGRGPAAAIALRVSSDGNTLASGNLQVTPLAPALFAANGDGRGPAAAIALRVSSDGNTLASGNLQVTPLAPALFAANKDGRGLAAAIALRVSSDSSRTYEPVAQFDQAQNSFVSVPIDLGPECDEVFLILFGTGIRFAGPGGVTAKIGGLTSDVVFAGPQGELVGLDQVNVILRHSLAGRGQVDVFITVDGQTSNALRVNIR